jgi:hypothetical protein
VGLLPACRPPAGVFEHNRLLRPDELMEADGRIVFYLESQGTFAWAAEVGQDDPPVWGRRNEHREQWQPEEEPLSRFLVQAVVCDAALCATHGALVSWLDPDQLARALSPLEPLPLGAWRWPAYPTRFYGGEDVVAVAMPNVVEDDDTSSSLYVAARTPEAAAVLDDVVEGHWEWYSPRDGPHE